MTAFNGKLFSALALVMIMLSLSEAQHFGESEVPSVLSYNSPLRKPDSLRSAAYSDFLSTLYRHDREKARYFTRSKRSTEDLAPASSPNVAVTPTAQNERNRRAIVFRPLFVYRQQEVRRQKIQSQRRRRY